MTSWSPWSRRHFMICYWLYRRIRRNIRCSGFTLWWITVTTMVLTANTRMCSATSIPKCPADCACTYRGTGTVATVYVNCSHAHLSTLPQDLGRRVELIDLSHNPLRVITEDYFEPHTYLHTIDLSYCSIHTIFNGAFNDLNRLRVLDLHGNMLSDLDPAVLSDLPSLVDLDLSHNKLTSLGADLLLYTRQLKKFKLQHNKLTSLPKENSEMLSSLESLNLNSNPLKELPESFFKSLNSLSALHLANTQLHGLPEDVFSNLRQLKVLNLADNFLQEISASSFKHVLRTVHSLNLSGNPINCSCVNFEFRILLEQHPLVWESGTAATCSYPPILQGHLFHQVDIAYFDCDINLENLTLFTQQPKKKKGEEESPYKSKLGPLNYNPMMGWYTAATLSGMLVLFLLCLMLDQLKRGYYKYRRARRMRHEKASYASGSLRFSGKGSHNSIDGMDSISMVAIHGNAHNASFNTSFNTSFDTDKDSLAQGRPKSNVSLGTPPLTNDNRAAHRRLQYKEKRARPDTLSLSTTSQRTYRFPALPIDYTDKLLRTSRDQLVIYVVCSHF